MNKHSLLKPNIYRSEVLIVNDKLKLTLDNSRNIFSLNKNNDEYNKFNSVFKNFFSFLVPDVSKFNYNDNSIVLWSRTNSYMAITNLNFKELISSFGFHLSCFRAFRASPKRVFTSNGLK